MRLRKRKWMDPLIEENKDFLLDGERLIEFLNKDNLILEIGSGKGGFIYQMALNNPQYEYLGIEVNNLVLAIALKTYKDKMPLNLHFVLNDINALLENIKDNSIKDIYLNFSDPWIKKRQNKRRLTYPSILKKYYRILKKGGRIYFKTDNELFFNDSITYFKESPFEIELIDDDYILSKDDVETEYEHKFRAEGKKIKKIMVRKGDKEWI